jgi:hypothetical protein
MSVSEPSQFEENPSMPSPFPGMNPYLEQEDAWRDFHERFLPHVAEALSPQVSPAYLVKLEQNLYIHERGADERHLLGYGDVTVSQTRGAGPANTATAVLTSPRRILLPRVDVESESYLEIRDRQTRRLVTVIELLSPTNNCSETSSGCNDAPQFLQQSSISFMAVT